MIGGQAKGWRGGKREGSEGIQKYKRGEDGKNREEKELDGPFFQSVDTDFVSLAHSNLHTQYAAAVW